MTCRTQYDVRTPYVRTAYKQTYKYYVRTYVCSICGPNTYTDCGNAHLVRTPDLPTGPQHTAHLPVAAAPQPAVLQLHMHTSCIVAQQA
jgi:hypothetical protein